VASGQKKKNKVKPLLLKSATGIQGLDEITKGGLPKGRPTLVAGAAGCGKTLFAMEFLVRGAEQFNEPGIFVSFEENSDELINNFSSLGFDLKTLTKQNKVILDYIYIERSEIEVTGEYDLEGLFVRLGSLIDSIGAKRIVLDTLEALFGALPNEGILRAELRRLFRWLKKKGVTAIITAEKGQGSMTRHGLEEYVSDCVIVLDHQMSEGVATRRMRIAKYRGSLHGTNEYPFLIEGDGISVLPITSLGLTHKVSNRRISSGIPKLDSMLGGKGFFRGSSILVSGTAGTGKSSMSAHFAYSVCKRGERCLYLAFEESESQIVRNMLSIGIDLAPLVKKGLLKFHTSRPTFQGLEMHLATIHSMIEEFKPQAVIIDPVTNLTSVGTSNEVKSMLTRIIDFMKMNMITAFFTNLSHQNTVEKTDIGLSSLMDTWILLRAIEINGERNRGLYVLKSRGMAHSNQIREFRLTNKGIDLVEVYMGGETVLTGTARIAQEAKESAETIVRSQELEWKQRELERKRRATEAQIELLRSQYEAEKDELNITMTHMKKKEDTITRERKTMALIRDAHIKN